MSYKPLEHSTTKKHIEEIIERSLHTSDSLFILSNFDYTTLHRTLRGQLEQVWKQTETQRKEDVIKNIHSYTHTLPWSEQPARMLWNKFVENVGIVGLREIIAQVQINDRAAAASLPGVTHETFLSCVLEMIVNPFIRSATSLSGSPTQLLLSFLTDTCSASELRKLGVSRNLTTEDCYRLLRLIMKCQKGTQLGQDLATHVRLWIVFDEAENLLLYSAKDRSLFVKGIIHLLSTESSFITFWLNIADPLLNTEEIIAITEAYGTTIWQHLSYDLTDPPSEKITATEIIGEAKRENSL